MDRTEAHNYFSCECFNQTWSFLDLKERSAEQVREMLACAHASLFHWMQRSDCEPINLSVGLWQVSRVYATLGSAEEAMRFAQDCLKVSTDGELAPFYLACGHEAVARAAILTKDVKLAQMQLESAMAAAEHVEDIDNKAMIESDIKELSLNITP